MSQPQHRPAVPLLDSVLNQLGRDIVSGTLEEGTTFTLFDLGQRFTISRTVAREAMRALEQLGLVASSRRVGITVQPRSQWYSLDQAIIDWRLDTESELRDQLRSLAEFRIGVEPVAARLAAQHATRTERSRLLQIGMELRELGMSGHGASEEFLELDVAFHSLLLRASGNDMFAALVPSVTAMLKGRTAHGLQPTTPDPRSLECHVELAQAVKAGNGDSAKAYMEELLDEAREHLYPLTIHVPEPSDRLAQ